MAGIFRAYDIRGSYPEELNETIAEKIGGCFVKYLKAERIVVGRDMRLSSPALENAFLKGAARAGAYIADIGMSTTPMLYWEIQDGGYDGGAMVTASHLPSRMNGFKLCRHDAIPLSGDAGLPVIERMVRDGVSYCSALGSHGSVVTKTILTRYVNRLGTFVHNPTRLNVVVDAGNGTVGQGLTRLFALFPQWKLIPMYMEPNGSFPHHVANPLIPANTRDLQKRVITEKADIGVAFDGDADRCGFVDEKGERIPEDLVTALIARFLLAVRPGSKILYDLRSSRVVPETIEGLGGKALRSRVGHSFIKARMRKEDAIFAGELSGHYYFKDTGFTDNALFAMIQMLNLLALQKRPVSELIRPLMRYSKTGEINIKVHDREKVFSQLVDRYNDARIDRLDGLTVTYGSWWFNVRPSNTEPVIRLNLEADDQEVLRERKKEVVDLISRADSMGAVS